MLRLRPTFEEIEREARTSRLRILPERQRRTQQGILLDEVEFDDFDLSKYDRKTILVNNNNPEKGTQTDAFNGTESESTKTPEEEIKEQTKEEKTENPNIIEHQQENEQGRTQNKSITQRIYDGVFGEDEIREEREEVRNMKQRIEEDAQLEPGELRSARDSDDENELSVEKQKTEENDNSLPVNMKKSYEPSSASSSSRRSSNRSVLLPVEEEALSEYVQSSIPETVELLTELLNMLMKQHRPKA